jgi:hypothetical protein
MNIRNLIVLSIALSIFSQILFAKEAEIDRWEINFQTNINKNKPEWTWTPSATFRIYGPVASSSRISVEYTLPSGKSWLKAECDELGRNIQADSFATVSGCGYNTSKGKEITAVGTFSFKIMLNNELSGKKQTLYTGKFKVGRQLYNPSNYPQNKNNYFYYIDRDFQLPFAYVGSSSRTFAEVLYCQTWLKGKINDAGKVRGYLFYNGKQIAEVQGSGVSRSESYDINTFNYGLYGFKFDILTAKTNSGGVDRWFKLYENQGDYEFKLLRDGKLSRIIKFTVGKDGKVIDTKIGNAEGFNGVFPAQISGDGDGTFNNSAWKEGWWGNPVAGFSVR